MHVSEILAIFGITGTLLMGALGYLIKTLISHFITKDFEVYKAKIGAEQEIEKMKFSILQEKRAETVAQAYALLAKFDNSMKDLIALFQPVGTLPEHEKAKIAADDGDNFLSFYNQNKIYFKQETCDIVDEMNEKFRQAWHNFQFKDKIIAEKSEDDLWLKAWRSLKEEIPILRKKLESDFRKIIGVE